MFTNNNSRHNRWAKRCTVAELLNKLDWCADALTSQQALQLAPPNNPAFCERIGIILASRVAITSNEKEAILDGELKAGEAWKPNIKSHGKQRRKEIFELR